MRDFLCELKLPAVLISVVTIVWCTAVRFGQADQQYYPADEHFTRLRQEAKDAEQQEQDLDATVRLELNP